MRAREQTNSPPLEHQRESPPPNQNHKLGSASARPQILPPLRNQRDHPSPKNTSLGSARAKTKTNTFETSKRSLPPLNNKTQV